MELVRRERVQAVAGIPVGAYLYSSPAAFRGRVYFGTYAGLVYSVSASSGRILWTRPAGGRYCLEPNPAVLAQVFSGGVLTRPAVVSIEYGNTANQGDATMIAEVRGDSADCPTPNTFEVFTFRAGIPANDVSFTLIVP